MGAPWYGQLSEQLEKKITGKVEVIEINILHDLGRAILFELKKLVLIAGVGIPLLLLNLLLYTALMLSQNIFSLHRDAPNAAAPGGNCPLVMPLFNM